MTEILVDVGPLLGESGGSLHVAGEAESPGMTVGQDAYVFTGPIAYDLRIDAAGDMLVLSGTAVVPTRVDCVRCLVSFDSQISTDLDVCIVEPDAEDSIPDEQERLLLPDDTQIDLWPVLESAIAGGLPYAPIHDASCAGLCATCGADRNLEPCECEEESVDSPFAVLKGLFEEGDDPQAP